MKYWSKWFAILQPLEDNSEREAYRRGHNIGFEDAVLALGDDLCMALDRRAEGLKKRHRKGFNAARIAMYEVLDDYEQGGDPSDFMKSKRNYWKATWQSGNSISKEWDSFE